ncbi:hypothetical protein V6N13_120013 [Hibiscus sabdariffa]|uniref:Uncharacterized protein n=2 Tax=Hibiscus sabdariffa TaxID=183260 RepID=A0ABR2A682_9ROSI
MESFFLFLSGNAVKDGCWGLFDEGAKSLIFRLFGILLSAELRLMAGARQMRSFLLFVLGYGKVTELDFPSQHPASEALQSIAFTPVVLMLIAESLGHS